MPDRRWGKFALFAQGLVAKGYGKHQRKGSDPYNPAINNRIEASNSEVLDSIFVTVVSKHLL